MITATNDRRRRHWLAGTALGLGSLAGMASPAFAQAPAAPVVTAAASDSAPEAAPEGSRCSSGV